MVSTRRSGSLSSPNPSSSGNTGSNENGNNNKRSSSAEDKPPSPKRQKVLGNPRNRFSFISLRFLWYMRGLVRVFGISSFFDKSVDGGVTSEKSGQEMEIPDNPREMCSEPPPDPVDCLPVDTRVSGADGAGHNLNLSKGEIHAPAGPASTPIAEGNTPHLRSAFSLVRNYQKQSLNFEATAPPWCQLLSQFSHNPNVPISSLTFTVGSSRNCSFMLKDVAVSAFLCRIKHTQREGSIVGMLETTGSKGSVQVNGMPVKKGSTWYLNSGDEIVFGSAGSHAYIFHILSNNINIKAPMTVGSAEVHSTIGKYLPVEKRSGDPSAVAGASILASLSSFRQDISRWRPPTLITPKSHQDSDLSTHAVIQDGSEAEIDGMEGNSTPNMDSDNFAEMGVRGKRLDCNLDSVIEAGNVLEERAEWTRSTQPASTSGSSIRSAALLKDILCGILDGKDVKVTFHDFPYYLRFGRWSEPEMLVLQQ